MNKLDCENGFVRPARPNARMMRRPAIAAAALLATTALSTPLLAQTADAPPPAYANADPNGVDLVTAKFRFSMTEGSIGSGDGAVTLMRYWGDNSWRDNWSGGISISGSGGNMTYTVEFGQTSSSFTPTQSGFAPKKADGSKLESVGTDLLRYTANDGTVVTFRSVSETELPIQAYACYNSAIGGCAIPLQVVRPNGETFDINWRIADKSGVSFFRFEGVTGRSGYGFTISYLTNAPGNFTAPQSDWYKRTGVQFFSPNGSCTSTTCPSLTYSTTTGPLLITDGLGRQWRFTIGGAGLTGIKRPGASVDTTTVSYGTNLIVTRGGVQTSYARSISGTIATTTITSPAGQRTVTADTGVGQVTSVKDELNRTTSYSYDTAGRPLRVTQPEGNYTEFTPDDRGNTTKTRSVSKTPGTPLDLVTSASYPSSCASTITCNRPTSTTDARGAVTDYTYDPTHGGVTSITYPAAVSGGTRPQTRYGYTQLAGNYRLTSISACQTAAACAGTADEARTAISYNSDGTVASVTSGDGTGALGATSAMTYDIAGNVVTIDAPLAGNADTTRLRYDVMRQRVGTVGPDPDGAGPLKNRASRTSYNADGQITAVERGTVNSQSDADWAAFAVLDKAATSYDGNARKATDTLVAGGTTYSLVQYSYDAMGRPECQAVRMDTGTYGSLPASACTLASATPGPYGLDRITRAGYDAAGQVTSIKTGYGTPVEQTATIAWTPDVRRAGVADGKNNLTSYSYDGFDRLSLTSYPSPTTAGTSSGTDNELLGYDPNGNVVSRRLRNGATISYAYDNLNRLTGKTLPTGTANLNPTFSYDLLGRMTQATNSASLYNTSVALTYDALGRKLSETTGLNGATKIKTMQYDLKGRRIKLDWGDGIAINYEYDLADDMTVIRENGATAGVGVLATFSYDDLGRRAKLTRGNGAITNYAYDPASRLTSLGQDFAGTTDDLTVTFASYSPAGEIGSRTASNDLYAYTASANGTSSYTSDGLNRYNPAAGQTTSYDPRGNMTGLGSTTFSYSAENELALTGTSNRLYYDALHRLVYSTSSASRFDWDGDDMVTIYDGSGNPLRRFVHGPGEDEPLVWYEGAGIGDRRFIHADERGSVIATSNGSGQRANVLAYDEYGVPKAGNSGRFQYTGQIWLQELGMYYYKARIYNPTIGRFMQTDPIGYDDGLNWYNYVDSDPINNTDPTGLACGSDDDPCTGPDIVVTAKVEKQPTSPGFSFDLPSFINRFYRVAGAVRRATMTQNIVPEPCASQTTPPAAGRKFNVDRGQALAAAAGKYLQHVSPIGPRGNPQSTFGGDLAGPVDLYNLIGDAIEGNSAVPASRGSVRITTATGRIIGNNARNGGFPTQYLTVILTPTGTTTDGLPDMTVTSVYPGCPR